jgi:hypothetical protein
MPQTDRDAALVRWLAEKVMGWHHRPTWGTMDRLTDAELSEAKRLCDALDTAQIRGVSSEEAYSDMCEYAGTLLPALIAEVEELRKDRERDKK